MKKGISKLIVNIIVLASFLEQFLDTGWYTEATLYYKGYTYWFEGNVNEEGKIVFSVYKYKSIIVDEIYTRRSIKDGDVEDYQVLVNKLFDDLDQAKKFIFSEKLFEGKYFWEVESELAWYDEF